MGYRSEWVVVYIRSGWWRKSGVGGGVLVRVGGGVSAGVGGGVYLEWVVA